MYLAAAIPTLDGLLPEWLKTLMGSHGFWIGFVVFFTVLGVAAFFYNFQDINKEEDNLADWDKYAPSDKGGKPQEINERELCGVFNRYSHAAPGKEVQDSKGLAQVLAGKQVGTLHLLEERLLTITSLVRESNNIRIMPDVSEMHDLSLQSIESKWATKLLNMSVSCVLVCGICGTLWSVHANLLTATQDNLLQELGRCLLPSMFAVLVNILLVIFRHVTAVKLDRLLEELDERTITQFIPALQPESNLGQSINAFTTVITTNPDDPRMDFISKAPQKILGVIQKVSACGALLAEKLQHYVSRLVKLFQIAKLLRDALERQREDTEALAGFSSQLQEKARTLSEYVQAASSTLRQFRELLAGAPTHHPDYAEHSRSLGQAETALESISSLPERIREWKQTYATILSTSQQHINFYDKKQVQVSNLLSEITPICGQLSEVSASMANFRNDDSCFAPVLQIESTIHAIRDAANEAVNDIIQELTRTCETHTSNVAGLKSVGDGLAETLDATARDFDTLRRKFSIDSRRFKGNGNQMTARLLLLAILVALLTTLFFIIF